MSVIPSKSFSVPDADYYEAPEEGFDVFTWSKDPVGTVNATPAQVHVHLQLAFGRLLIRFKSPRTLDALIEALTIHREDVWGKR